MDEIASKVIIAEGERYQSVASTVVVAVSKTGKKMSVKFLAKKQLKYINLFVFQ